MKDYLVTITEINGEQEYTHYCIIKAKTPKSADNQANKIAKKWYDFEKPVKLDEGEYEHLGGQVIVKVDGVDEFNQEDFINKFRR